MLGDTDIDALAGWLADGATGEPPGPPSVTSSSFLMNPLWPWRDCLR